jgi:hypothetical protein
VVLSFVGGPELFGVIWMRFMMPDVVKS